MNHNEYQAIGVLDHNKYHAIGAMDLTRVLHTFRSRAPKTLCSASPRAAWCWQRRWPEG